MYLPLKRPYLHKVPIKFLELQTRDEDPVLAKKPDPGLCTSNKGRFLSLLNEYLRFFNFSFHIFGVRRPL